MLTACVILSAAMALSPADDILLAPAAGAVDARVKQEKIGARGLPTLPESLAQPLPVIHRIANGSPEVPMAPEAFATARASISRGLQFLRNSQGPRGGWMEGEAAAGTDQEQRSLAASTAVTALGVRAFVQAGESRDSPAVTRACDWVTLRTMRDGVFDPDRSGGLGNYVAAAVASGWAALGDSSDVRVVQVRDAAVQWLKSNQWDQAEGIQPTQDWFGGAGYGKHGRPDLSNTQVMLDALHDAGVSPDDPAVQRALIFVARTQNLKSSNDAAWAKHGSGDGGFVYTPTNGGESFASEAAGEGRFGEIRPEGSPQSLRSYGSMSYAGLKSMLYAGLTRDDPRVRAAWDWIRHHWSFAENPGLGQQGHYYYLHAMARALAAAQQDVVVDAHGVAHNWREELVNALVAMQQDDGSWTNPADRWEEGHSDLVTIYALLALEEALKPTLKVE